MWSRLGLDLPTLSPGTAGDPGLFGPQSLVWRIGREKILLLGGPAALLLQVAHPLIAAGVAGHSDFEGNPFGRLRSTLDATLRIVYGDTEQAAAATDQVRAIHRRVRGTLVSATDGQGAGTPYSAEDPELALWVHATLVHTALEVYDRFVHRLGEQDRAGYYDEARRLASLFGAETVTPGTYEEFEMYRQTMEEKLAVGANARGLAGTIMSPPLPVPGRPAVPFLRAVTSSLLPEALRAEYRLRWGPAERRTVAIMSQSLGLGLRWVPERIRFWPHYRVALHRVGLSA
jgi:uncharacterized protein (DUF2236 family)